MLSNPGDGNETIVVVTGGRIHGPEASTEFWIPGSDSWTPGPDLPIGISLTSGFTTPDGKGFVVVAGGGTDGPIKGIYKLSFQDDGSWNWTKMEQELKVARESHLAMLIPDSLTTCN